MRAADLINNGKFNYETFNGIPKYKQDVLIVLQKDAAASSSHSPINASEY